MNVQVARAVGPLWRARAWRCSLPLIAGALVYLYAITRGKALLHDGDTLWHIAAGRWILANGAIPTEDPFSHTMRGAPWMAHEWLAEILLAAAHDSGGWNAVSALTALAFAGSVALLTRALLRWLEPIQVVLAAIFAILMTGSHLLARPHILAMPLLVLWMIGLVRAREQERAPSLWLLPAMAVWANLHGGFTLGLALAFTLAAEAALAAWNERRLVPELRGWVLFLALTILFALATPQGANAFVFTWQVMFEDSFALTRIGEWRSPDFHRFQPLEVWLLAVMALALFNGLRLPPVRLLLLLGLIHLSLKHIRNVELLGFLAPLIAAPAFSVQWQSLRGTAPQYDLGDRVMRALAAPAGPAAVVATMVLLAMGTLAIGRGMPAEPPQKVAPAAALRAVEHAGVKGPVFNDYSWGGYLIYSGYAPFIDGRADVYRDSFIKEFVYAMDVRDAQSLPELLDRYGVMWTLLAPDRAATALLDHLPGWRRLYADDTAVVHVKTTTDQAVQHRSGPAAPPSKE